MEPADVLLFIVLGTALVIPLCFIGPRLDKPIENIARYCLE